MKKTLSVFAILICISTGIFISSTFWRTYTFAKIYSMIGQKQQSLACLNEASLIENDYILPSLHYKASQHFISALTLQDIKDNPKFSDTLLELLQKNSSSLKNDLPKAVLLIQKYGIAQLKSNKSNKGFLSFIDKIKKTNPNSSLSYYLKGTYYFKKKSLKKAQAQFELAATRQPFYQSMLKNLFFIYKKNKQYQKIIDLNITVKRSDVITPTLASYIGESYYQLRQFKLAVKYLQVAKKQKNNHHIYVLLGRIGIRKDQPDLAEYLLKAYKVNKKNIQPLLQWLDYKFNKKDFTSILSFYDQHKVSHKDYRKIILKTIAATGDYKRFEDFVGENSIDTLEFPLLIFYRAKTDLQNKNWTKSREKYLAFLKVPISSQYKAQIYKDLLICNEQLKDYQSILEFSQKLLSIDPENIKLYISKANAYFKLKKSYQAMKVIAAACQFFPEDKEHIHFGVKILKEEGSTYRLVNFLKNIPLVSRDLELGVELVRAAIKTFQNRTAYSTLKKLMVDKKIRTSIPQDLKNFFKDFKDTSDKEIKIRENSTQQYSDLISDDIKFKDINKHQLPPAPEISRTVQISGFFNTNYQYKGFALESIPEGSKVELLERIQVENSQDYWYSIRFEKNRFRIKEKYLDIIYPPNQETMGKAYITNIDKDYHAYGMLSRYFKKDETLTIKSHHNSDLKKKIQFNEDSWVKFGKIPTKTYTAEILGTTYKHIHPDVVNVTYSDFAFVKQHAFQYVVDLEIENKVALFGPNHAGVSVFQRDKSNYPVLLHKSVIEDRYSQRKTDQDFSDLLFKGYLVLDVNGDDILDYLSVWQSNIVKEKGIIHILTSNSIVSYSEFYLQTELSFVKNYKYVSTINPLLFLKNFDDNKFIEILTYKDLGRKGDPDNSVAWYDIYNVKGSTLRKNSIKYPGFYEEQLYKLLDMYKTKKSKLGKLSDLYENSYQDAVNRINEILEKVKFN
ncbi:MAG: hypothetical protein KC646_00415 [Candidatus Cloacimonetes bacterium]|nr:hypothetical protein [Candidatus Cloacimonadota bacterium]